MPFVHENTWGNFSARHGEGELNVRYERALERLMELLTNRRSYPIFVAGRERRPEQAFQATSPLDAGLVMGEFPLASAQDASDAVLAAKAAFLAWRRTDLAERVRMLRRAADIIRQEKFDLAALITMCNGKVRREALGEVDMGIDYIEFYAQEMERNQGYAREMRGPSETEGARNVMLPYGPWAIICPFNFPFGISMGMLAGVLMTGNTAVMKPASPTPAVAHAIYGIMARAGIPDGALNLVTGTGAEVGETLVRHPSVEGIIFTGSKEVGQSILRNVAGRRYPIPVVLELGGKNAAIVTPSADLDRAVRGVVSSAFGYSGQKCVACSRVYVHEEMREAFVERLVKETMDFKVMDPRERDARTGPVIHAGAVESFEKASAMARLDGKVEVGGRRLTAGAMARGCYVEPTVVTGLPDDHFLVQNELFLPFLCVQTYTDLDGAIAQANSVPYGLTAGIYSRDQGEVERFLDGIECGLAFANGARGATNGAIIGTHSFGGWKASGSTGRGSGDVYYLMQFMRQQGRAYSK